jgi:5-methylcytosine-specific restriction endonuclease McrA
MSGADPNGKPVRLDAASYELLRQEILQRDGWRCQFCGTMSNLQVHHQQFRSQAGADVESNLITLCADCHSIIHCHG